MCPFERRTVGTGALLVLPTGLVPSRFVQWQCRNGPGCFGRWASPYRCRYVHRKKPDLRREGDCRRICHVQRGGFEILAAGLQHNHWNRTPGGRERPEWAFFPPTRRRLRGFDGGVSFAMQRRSQECTSRGFDDLSLVRSTSRYDVGRISLLMCSQPSTSTRKHQ